MDSRGMFSLVVGYYLIACYVLGVFGCVYGVLR
jgi:hypothetical protein